MEKPTKVFKKNPLFFSFLLPMLTDGIMTLVGQNPSYWTNYQSANEMSPAYFFMAAHPLLFILGGIIWFVGLYWLFLKLKYPLNLMLACTFIAGNTWGSISWITKMMKDYGFLISTDRFTILFSWTVLVLYFLVIGVFAGLSISQYINNFRGKK